MLKIEKAGVKDGKDLLHVTLKNETLTVKVFNYGAIITSITMPDKAGNIEDIVLGFDELDYYYSDQYNGNCPYLGCVAGRFANRIANGKMTIEGKEYSLATNNGPNHLHGGLKGFNRVVWDVETDEVNGEPCIKLSYTSPDMEDGYPGTLNAVVVYTLTKNNELKIDYSATTDKTTVVNLTQHTYFNLSGYKTDITSHLLQINAERVTERDETLIPTGKLTPVKGTMLDFTTLHPVGDRITESPDGYDHNYVLDNKGQLKLSATVVDPQSGRAFDLFATQPGVQLYSAFWLDGSHKGHGGKPIQQYGGLCLETQHYPDSPNHADFPSTLLEPGNEYKETAIFKFYLK